MRSLIGMMCLAVVLTTAGQVQATFLVNANPTISLDMGSTAGYPMNIAWNPVFNQYYGGGGGYGGASGRIWNSVGNVVQTLTPINDDLRSFYFNPGTGNLEEIAFGSKSGFGNPNAGLKTVGLDGSGLYTGVFTTVLSSLSGLATDQVVPAYDANRNVLYSHSGSTVFVADRVTGSLVGNFNLDLVAAGNPSIMALALGYDSVNDALIQFDVVSNRALAFNATNGAFLAAITLNGLVSPDSAYSMAYTNNQMFIFDHGTNSYKGFTITDSPTVPEPATMVLWGIGSLGMGLVVRRKKKLAAIA